MPSLKDLRNRIASVKATQKITKAMQMVAAAKLRRAQSAAEAARPYATRMEAVLANRRGAAGREGGSPLMVGTGKDKVHLLACTAERTVRSLQLLHRQAHSRSCLSPDERR
jgi:F-type H+-transporting ATPase subunit gamma